MAIRIPDLGTGSGAVGDGDNELEIRQDYNHNFTDQSNAASRLVGIENGQVPLVEQVPSLLGTAAAKEIGTAADQVPLSKDIFKVNSSKSADINHGPGATGDCNNFALGTTVYFAGVSSMPGFLNTPRAFMDYFTIHTFAHNGSPIQMAFSFDYSYSAAFRVRNYGGIWGEWKALGESSVTYHRTTASGANVVVGEDGKLYRSTSSERYKDILAPLELDDARYADAMALKPIVYRSSADADNPAYHYYSFSAEELGAYDPAFTLWRTTEMVTDADGNMTEQPLAEKQAEGININALLAMSHAIAIKQGELIKDLQEQINALKSKLEV